MSVLSTLSVLSKRKRGTLPTPISTLDWAMTLVIHYGCNVLDVAVALRVAPSSLYARKLTHQAASPGPPSTEFDPSATEIARLQAAITNITTTVAAYVPPSIEALRFPHYDRQAMLRHLLQYLDEATTSINVSMYMLTHPAIAAAVLAAHGRRVAARIITSRNTMRLHGSQIQLLFDTGIKVRVHKNKSYLMHNKYALIDNSILINGSFNWTARALSNSENIIIWRGGPLVGIFQASFSSEWVQFEPVTTSHFANYVTTLCPHCVLTSLESNVTLRLQPTEMGCWSA